MERMVGMLNVMTAINLLVAAAYLEVTFEPLLSGVVRGVIGVAVLAYFGLALDQMANVAYRSAVAVPGVDA